MVDVEKTKLCSELYDILGACNDDELAHIVDLLTKAPASVLKITRAFERYHPEHVRYADQIGDEIYRLGLAAIGRNSGSRPTYGSIVGALCKQIGIPAAPSDIETEAILLNTFSKQHLSSLPPADRQLVVMEACTAASSAASGMLSSEAWPVVASTILQVAYLRRKLAEEGRMPPKRGGEAHAASGGVPALVDDGAGALMVQTEGGDPILSVSYPRDVDAAGWRGVDGSKVVDLLAPVLKAVQPFVTADELLKAGNYMRVTVPRGTKLVHSDKLGHLVGVAKDQKGHFKSIRLDPASVAKLASPAALLTLASAMAEQQKLEEIERSLAEIKAVLGDVSKFQRDERRSVLTGSIRYLNQVAPSILAGELGSEVLHEIERHEAELVRIQEHLMEELRTQVSALFAIRKEGWGSGKYVKAIEDAQAAFDRMYAEMSLCIRARACGYQLLCCYPGREAGKRARLEDISTALHAFSVAGEVTVSMDKVLREKIKGISSYETKALLLNNENALFDRLGAESSSILGGLEKARRGLLEQAEPISIELRIEDGQAVAMRML